jgi:subtilisin family serine protease
LTLLTWPAAAEQEYVVRTLPGAAAGVVARHGLNVLERIDLPHASILRLKGAPTALLDTVRRNLRVDPGVVNVELNSAVVLPELNQSTVAILDGVSADRTMTTYFNDPVWAPYLLQPAAQIVQLQEAQQSYATGAGIVAIIDTGVDPAHAVLSGSLVSGYDFTREMAGPASELLDLSPTMQQALAQSALAMTSKQTAILNQSTVAILDQSTVAILDGSLPAAFGHGTMVAGLVHLVAPEARIMPLKAFTGDGAASLFNIIRAVYFAVARNARAINMSFSMSQPSEELAWAIAYANANRVVCIASVGNSGVSTSTYPAAWKKVVGVASVTNSDVRSSFSNYGGTVTVAAPGDQLITTYPGNNYAAVWGTSFSAALVSGGAALLRQIDANLSQDQATTALSQAVDLGADLGAGRIDLYRACGYWSAQKTQ